MRVVVSAGGTGGHIYPAISVIDKLKSTYKDLDILYIGTNNRMESSIVPELGIPYEGIEIYGLSKNIIKDIKNVYCLKKSYNKCVSLLKEFKPDLVMGFGGYVTYPVIKAAKKLKIKTFLHEQNSVVGKTNRALAKNIDLVAVSFPNTIDVFKKAKKVIYTGNPCSIRALNTKEIKPNEIGLDNHKKLVVIVAGSLGSSSLNQKLKQFLLMVKNKNYQVLYITGKKYYEEFMKDFKVSNNVKIMPFLDNLPGLLKNTDLLITRAGASTISEVLALKIPAIFIPSPYVANNHQYFNAKAIVDKNAGLLIEEDSLTAELLFKTINDLINDKDKLDTIKNNLKEWGSIDSSEVIRREIEGMLK